MVPNINEVVRKEPLHSLFCTCHNRGGGTSVAGPRYKRFGQASVHFKIDHSRKGCIEHLTFNMLRTITDKTFSYKITKNLAQIQTNEMGIVDLLLRTKNYKAPKTPLCVL